MDSMMQIDGAKTRLTGQLGEPSRESSTSVQVDERKSTKRKFVPLWYVILHDDQNHTYDYVIEMLTRLFAMSVQQALIHALEVDTQSVTIVARLPKEKAEQKRDEIRHYGGDPLMRTTVSMKATIEPADD